MAAWSCALFVVVRDGYESFRIGRFDFGNMVQAVWSTVDGRLLETTDGATGEQMSRLSVHVDPLLVLLTPLWIVWPSPLVLALAQIVVVSLGALPVFWLGRRHLGSERAAALLALGYLAYPWVVTSAASAIHPVTFAVPFALYLRLVSRYEPAHTVRALRATRDVDGRAHGAPDPRPRRLVRAGAT